MKTLVIKDYGDFALPGASSIDLSALEPKHCVGCWSCWWKTPGVCVHRDLDDFYRKYVNAGQAVFFAQLQNGMISGRMKSLLDRMIPLFLPYTTFAKGGTWHVPRYPKYPDILFYYHYEFADQEERSVFHGYIRKVFEQFYSKNIQIEPVSCFKEAVQ